MRIALFTDTYFPDVNGVVSSIDLLNKKLIDDGNEVFIICPYPGFFKIIRENNLIKIPGIKLNSLYGYVLASPFHPSLIDEIKKLNLDLIHVHTEGGVGLLARYVAKKNNIPLISTYHTTYEDYTHYVPFLKFDLAQAKIKSFVAYLSKIFNRDCNFIIAPSYKTKEMLMRYKIKENRIKVIPTGINLDKFKIEKDLELRKKFVNDDETLLLFVGRIAKEKDIDMLIKAMPLIDNKAKLLIIGDGPMLKELIELSNDLNLNDRINFIGKVPYVEIAKYYRIADCFISCSITETQGLTYIEALSSGLVLFGRDKEVLKDLIIEKFNGFYFEDTNDLATKINYFLKLSKDDKLNYANNANNLADKYSDTTFLKKIKDLYNEAIAINEDAFYLESLTNNGEHLKLKFTKKDNEYYLLCTSDDYYQLGLRKKQYISKEIYEKLLAKQDYLIILEKAIKRIVSRDYSIKEMYDYLIKNYNVELKIINDIIEKLIDKGLLNDFNYAKNRINTLKLMLYSKKKIKNDLFKKGISYEIIEELLINYKNDNEINNCLQKANKLLKNCRNLNINGCKLKIRNKLLSEGYDNDIINLIFDRLDFTQINIDEEKLIEKDIEKYYKRYSKKYDSFKLRNAIFMALSRKNIYDHNMIYTKLDEINWEDDE